MGFKKAYIEEFPVDLRPDPDWIAFAALLNQLDGDAITAIDNMATFFDLEKIPESLIILVGYATGAQVGRGDSNRLKRQKVRDAIRENKRKGTEDSAIHWIEQITGVTPEFDTQGGQGRFAIWESLNNLLPFPNDFMKWESSANVDTGGWGWGSIVTGGANERFIVFIDTKVNNLNPVDIDRLERVVEYFGAAYIRYHIGFKDPEFNFYRTVH